MGMIDVSIDPGTNATGYCFWRNGKVIILGTIYPNAKASFVDKAVEIHWALVARITNIVGTEDVVRRFAVEDFVTKYKDRDGILRTKESMIKCGAIQGVCVAVGLRFTANIMLVSKDTISKAETAMLAKANGVKGSKDALDAYQIGICAGFDKK